MKSTYAVYLENSKELFKNLFGEELYNKLDSTPLKSIDWKGKDVDSTDIIATFPNIKDRFSEEWIEYFSEKDFTLLDMYVQTIFHYGYQQCSDKYEPIINKILNHGK